MRSWRHTPGTRRPATVAAMLVVAIVAVFQTGVICLLLGEEHNAAHIIDISGQQRMRTQKLAFFALTLHADRDAGAARAEIARTVDEMKATRAELRSNMRFDSGSRDSKGRTATGLFVDRYIQDVQAVSRHPSDEASFLRVMSERENVVLALDRAVKSRVRVVNTHNDELLATLLVGLILQLASIACVWFAIVAPSERRSERLLRDVRSAQEQIESSFTHNPDAIGVFDLEGRVVHINASRAKLLGYSLEASRGRHFTHFLREDRAEQARAAMERAKRGDSVSFETQLRASDGSFIDVSTSIFPRIVENRPAGVNIVSRDLRKLRAAEAENVEQARRLADLYEIASSHGRTTDQQFQSALGLVAVRLGYDYGVITEIIDDTETIVGTYGKPQGVVVGDRHALKTSLSRISIPVDIYQARDFHLTPYATPAIRKLDWRGVVGMKILAGGVLYGTIGFAARTVREADLSDRDVAFVRLACALLGTIIERSRQMRRLDALAFTDSLTGLPNRAHFDQRLAELVAKGEPFGLHYVDLDRFKKVNDRCGHTVGDMVLTVTAKRLLNCARVQDFVARLGGDEFAILQLGPIDVADGAHLAERVVDTFSNPIDIGGIRHDVGASVGLALFPKHGSTLGALVDSADTALYRAKRGGRGRFAYPEGETHVSETA